MNEWANGPGLLELESVQRAIAEAGAWAGAEFSRRCVGYSRFTIARLDMESPIEAIFFVWFNAVSMLEDTDVMHVHLGKQMTVNASSGRTYRIDFVAEIFGDIRDEARKRHVDMPRIAVELDGHDFHERTKEQVAYRNERDRDLQADGWTILHFSGSELYRDPVKCATSVFEFCRKKHDEWIPKVYGE